MATVAELEDALRNADKAGDADAARRLADALVAMRGQAAPAPASDRSAITGPYVPFVDDTGMRAPQPRVGAAPGLGQAAAVPPEALQAASVGATVPAEPDAPEYARSTRQAMKESVATLPLLAVGGKALEASTKLGRLAGGAKAAGGGGALFGVATGEGSAEERLERGVVTGATGVALGLTLPALFNGAAKLVSAAGKGVGLGSKTLNVRERTAIKQIMRAFREDKIPEIEARRRLKEWAAQGGEPAALFDLGGPSVERLARRLGSHQSPAASLLQGEVDTRLAGQADEVADALARTVSQETDYAGAVEGLHLLRQKRAAPLYDRAYQDTVEITPRLQAQLRKPSARRSLKNAERIAEEEEVDLGRLGLVRNESGDLVFSDRVNVQALDYLKRGFDDELAPFRDPRTFRMNHTQESRAIDNTLHTILKETDKQSPAYAAARNSWSGPAKSLDALALGKDVFKPSITPEVMAQRIKKMGDGDREYLRAGVVRAITDKVENTPDGANVVKKFFNREAFRKKLRLIFDNDEQVDAFEALMRRQLTKAERSSRVAPTFGSQTELRGADVRVGEQVGESMVRGTPIRSIIGGAAATAARALRSRQAIQRRNEENEAIFRMLFSRDNPLGILEQGRVITGPTNAGRLGATTAVISPGALQSRERRVPAVSGSR